MGPPAGAGPSARGANFAQVLEGDRDQETLGRIVVRQEVDAARVSEADRAALVLVLALEAQLERLWARRDEVVRGAAGDAPARRDLRRGGDIDLAPAREFGVP